MTTMAKKQLLKKEKQVKDYIRKVISEISTFVPIIQTYTIRYKNQEANSSGGVFSVVYEPTNFNAEFYIYQNIFNQIPDEGLVEGFKQYIKGSLGHEIGHCYIWELEGTERNTEKIASLIGFLIAKILDSRGV